jgi:hypothetical protein
MKKIIIILSLLISSIAYADHEKDFGEYYFQQIPALCTKPELVDNYLNHFGFEPVNVSLGREGMQKDGQPVYMVTYYINKDNTETTATIDIPSGSERCLIFHTFDLTKPLKN